MDFKSNYLIVMTFPKSKDHCKKKLRIRVKKKMHWGLPWWSMLTRARAQGSIPCQRNKIPHAAWSTLYIPVYIYIHMYLYSFIALYFTIYAFSSVPRL